MAKTTAIENAGRRLCRHTVCYTDAQSRMVAARALQGITTKAIAEELGITQSQVQYAILKAQHSLGVDVRFRRDYRNGKGPVAQRMMQSTQKIALQTVSRKIAPKFVKFAAPGVPRLPV
jgi:hypothetical protein